MSDKMRSVRLVVVVTALVVGFAVLAFVLFLIALNDVGRVIDAWALFFLVLFVALGLRLAAWAFHSRLLVRAAIITAVVSPIVFLLWSSWNWATFLRFPDIPSEKVLFSHNWRWSIDGNGDAFLLPKTEQGLCPCDGLTFRPPRSDPLVGPPSPEYRFEGAAPRLKSSAWARPVATKALAALADPASPLPEQVRETWSRRVLDDLAPNAEAPCDAILLLSAPATEDGAVAQAGETLFRTIIAWDPLVFHVPTASPVRNLPPEQLADIFCGHVRTWRELGFDDEHAILPFEREGGEDAQTLALEWLVPGQKSFETPRPQWKNWTDEDAVDGHMAEFRAKPGAIGYSMHVMAAPLVREGAVRLISVGGAAPNATDIAAGRYPPGRVLELISGKPQDGNVRKLAAFLRSPVGRALLASAGFIPAAPDNSSTSSVAIAAAAATDDFIKSRIFTVRGDQVMQSNDLTSLHDVTILGHHEGPHFCNLKSDTMP